MTSFIEGECRTQATLFLERLDKYITENTPVRVIDVFVDEMDLGSLSFRMVPSSPVDDPLTIDGKGVNSVYTKVVSFHSPRKGT